MGSLFALLGTMGDALAAQQAGLAVTGQNVSNVNTPGYVRRSALLESRAVMPGTDGGIDVAGIQRAFDSFTYAHVLVEHGFKGAADSRSGALGEAQSIVAPGAGGSIADAMSAFFSSLQTLSANPSDPSSRSAVLTQAANLGQSFASASGGLAESQSALLSQAKGVAGELDSSLTQIAQLNAQIVQAQGNGDSAPDLRDKRDALIGGVADQLGASVVPDPSGAVTLFAAGATLVSGDKASSVDVSVDAAGAMKLTVNRPGGSPMDVTAGVTSGSLGGLREARDVDIAKSASQLDQLAFDLSGAVNAVHRAGYGLDGVSGRPLFVTPSRALGAAAGMALDPAMVDQPDRLAAAANAQDLPGGNDVAVQLGQLATQAIGAGGTPAQRFGSIAAQLGGQRPPPTPRPRRAPRP